VNASALSAAQVLQATAAGYSSSNTVTGTVHDDDVYTVGALYKVNSDLKVFGGYERIASTNPKSLLVSGFQDMGYSVFNPNQTAFAKTRIYQFVWGGVRYNATQKLEFDAAYYWQHQNDYGSGANLGCHTSMSGTCSGQQNVVSLVADYHFTRKFDAYAGVMYSNVADGLASGFLHNNNVAPTVGLRYTF